MKAILMSIQPKWCELIASGKKTIEVRKTRPKLDVPFKVYIYMTAGDAVYPVTINGAPYTCSNVGGKRVIGEFICDWIEPYWFTNADSDDIEEYEDVQLSCLTAKEIIDYGREKELYFYHILNLVIYDKPKELGDFKVRVTNKIWSFTKKLERPPQSWCYVEEEQS